uniref:Ribosomal protein S8 n=1 Tax=Trentepohlia odorata TaxID=2576626 RepID=A0A4Y5P3F0_9CHLO|nr:ribosomal protein S8 [Trentepohlia odorata]QCW57794.1 ribosomal protein S8 [Trentepohlia odorata]
MTLEEKAIYPYLFFEESNDLKTSDLISSKISNLSEQKTRESDWKFFPSEKIFRSEKGNKQQPSEPKKSLNLQKYLRKKNNKTFQTLFNPNYSKIILLAFNLNTKEKASIHGIRRVSKSSLRCYSSNPIPRSFGGLGIFIVSTNCGIMTDNEAREKNLGGEIMLEIW